MTDELVLDWVGDRERSEIHVLLVDDNEQWAELLAQDIQRAKGHLSVSIALSANEAIMVLQEDQTIDCVVADYQMPEIGGIQLLERVREEWPELPFILVTGEGSEDVASRAIDAGVTDYLIKNPRTDQKAVFASKIESAVEGYRLRQSIAESEERYRTVTEQSQDAIAIFCDATDLVFCNDRLVDLTGMDRETLLKTDPVAEAVHPEDRATFREILKRLAEDQLGDHLHETRIVSTEGDVRYCEFTGQGITYDGRAATLVSIRDVTERTLRERELEWERQLNRTVQRVLVESRTREQLEQAIADKLTAYGYSLVWFGDSGGAYPEARTAAGDAGYLDAIGNSIDEASLDGEPSIWALRSGEPQVVRDFTDLFETAWRDTALEHDLRSGAAIPLVYNDISYGVLAVYDDETRAFDETERKLLTDLGETVAFAVHNIETERALIADPTVEVQLHVTGETYYLADIAKTTEFRAENGQLTVHGTLPHGEDHFIQYVSVEGTTVDRFQELTADQPDVVGVDMISDEDDDWTDRFQIEIDGPTPEARLSALGALVRPTTVRPDGAVIPIEIPSTVDLREIVETLESTFGTVSIRSRSEIDVGKSLSSRQVPVDLDQLTDKQESALQAAFYHGYFEQPRRSSAVDVAESLDISHSTFLQHLRIAERKLLSDLFE